MKGVPVLMYHALEDHSHPAGAIDSGEQLYVLDVTTFKEQMEYLNQNGYKTLLLRDVVDIGFIPKKSVVITFDDGHESNYSLALPILLKYGFKAEFFITTGWVGTKNHLTNIQIKELVSQGMGIGSHGVTHTYLNEMSPEAILNELKESQMQLRMITKIKVISFSAPGGRFSKGLVEIGKKLGFEVFCSSEFGLFDPSQNNNTVPRYPLKNSASFNEFVKFVECNISYFMIHSLKTSLLFWAKYILGNKRYDVVRLLLLRYL